MALKKIVFQPGINKDITNYAGEGGWWACDKIRFRKGFPEKIGGWTALNLDAFVGKARSLLSYGTTDGNELISILTDTKFYILAGSTLIDVTPIRQTFVSPVTDNCFQTTSGSTTVTVNINSHGADDGDYVTFSGATAVGGVPASDLNKEFSVSNVLGNSFEITVDTAATSTVAAGGGTGISAEFQISVGAASSILGYGWGAGAWARGTWGSGTTTPIYIPERVLFQDKFNNDIISNIQDADIYYWQYDSNFNNRAVLLKDRTGARAVPEQVHKVLFAPTGHLLALACTEYNRTKIGGPVISSITNAGITATVTTATSHTVQVGDWIELRGQAPSAYQGEYQVVSVPTATTFTYNMNYDPGSNATVVGSYEEIDYTGAYDPLLIRFSNVDPDIGPQPEEWKPEVTNSAGFLRVKTGTQIITAFRTRQEVLVFTDVALNTLQFLGTEEVFSIQEISTNINIMGPNVVAEANTIVFWMGSDNFFMYDGRIRTLPCTLKQHVFDNMNKAEAISFFAGVNSEFNEIIWFYCSGSSTEINAYVIYNYEENLWYYGTLNRTAWIDANVIKNPLATSNGYVYKHETGVDEVLTPGAAATPIDAYIESADMTVEDGERFILTKRVIPDVNFTNSNAALSPEVQMTVGVRNFPGSQISTNDVAGNTLLREVFTSATIDQYTNQVYVRARGRQMNFKIASDTTGVQWQLGAVRVDFKPDGRRG